MVQNPPGFFSSVCELTELILRSKVSQNTENPKLGLLVTCENCRFLKNLCRFWRFEVTDDSGLDEVEEDDDAGAEDDEGEEGED